MRSQLFRQEKGVAATAATVTFLVDLDGATPVTLYLENMDQKAALVMRTGGAFGGSNTPATREVSYVSHGSKNGNLKFEAVAAGTVGNDLTVEVTAAANQVFSIVDLGSDDYKINLKCDASGKPIQLAYEVLIAIDNEVSAGATAYRAAINTTLAPGSNGSATMERLPLDAGHVIAASTDLQGGTAATTAGVAVVSTSPQSNGPYVTNASAGTALSTVAANTVKAAALVTPYAGVAEVFPTPLVCRGLKVVVTGGVTGTFLAFTIVAERMGQ